MAEENVKLGTSLLVPCVQELAKENLSVIPTRYVCPQQGYPINTMSDSVIEIPVIDMQKLVSRDLMDLEIDKMHLACKDWGFFQLVNHGVSSSLIKKVKAEIEDFFNLPMEEKKKYWQDPGEIEGFGQAFVISEEQKLDWCDIFFMTTLPLPMRKPHLFPKLPLPFRDTMENYSKEVKNVAMTILANMAKALKMEEEEMRNFFDRGWQAVRMNYYPPCPQPEQAIGLTPHSDAVGLTILLQISEVEGLQVKKDGTWVPVKPLPNSFIVNIGDILEIITNGAYRSIEHRAIVNSAKERLSIATFLSPTYEGEVGPAYSLINEQTPPIFKRLSVKDYFKGFFSQKLNGKSYLDVMRIQHDHRQGLA